MLDNKSIMVTGGTGSFGNAFIDLLLETSNPKEIIVFSRDEKKQHDMRISYAEPRLKFFIGNVRERDGLDDAMAGVDMVFHAAALKQVPSCEFFPMEAVKTNVLGTDNVLRAAEKNGVGKVVVLGTDKAVYPINSMGITKALMEKVMMAKGRITKSDSVFCGVRYGNVMYSRGSVIPLFVNQIKSGKPLTITHPDMTRFLLPLRQAVDLVLFAMEKGRSGDIFVRKAPAATVRDTAQALQNIFDRQVGTVNVGIREGEKMHETLVTQEEHIHSEDFGDYYRISGAREMNYDEYFTKGSDHIFPEEGYTSGNTRRLTVPEVEELLLSLPDIRRELNSWAS